MFIYKITVGNKHYYGLDTKPAYKKSRWDTHKREAMNPLDTNPLHTAMRDHGVENCHYEVIEEGFESMSQLGLAEIRYIADNDTYRNGLNSTPGGDGLGCHDLYNMNEDEIAVIKQSLSDALSEYNNKIKWAGLSNDERKKATSHLHNKEVYQKKSATLKEYYANNPEAKKEKAKGIAKWRENNRDLLLEQNRKASLIGAAKVSKKVKVEFDNGETKVYNSKSAYTRECGHDLKYILAKTKSGSNHKGKRAWEL